MPQPERGYWLHGTSAQVADFLVQTSVQGWTVEVLAVQSYYGGMSMLVSFKRLNNHFSQNALTILSKAADTIEYRANGSESGRTTPVCIFHDEA